MDISILKEEEHPFLLRTIEYINGKTFLLKNSFREIEETDLNLELGETLCKNAFCLSEGKWNEYYKKIDGLILYTYEFIKLQGELNRTGRYLYSSFREVKENAYKNKYGLSGPQYIWGMYFSLFFWPSRNMIYNFFRKNLVPSGLSGGLVLEAPVGAGMFLGDFLKNNKKWKGVGVDISRNSADISKKYLKQNGVSGRSKIVLKDIFKFESKKLFNKIICGDFLEHVENPVGVLEKFRELLKDDGRVFVSVAVWAANIDHIYLYKSAEGVRAHIHKGGFRIVKESINNIIKGRKKNDKKTPINYCAILAKD